MVQVLNVHFPKAESAIYLCTIILVYLKSMSPTLLQLVFASNSTTNGQSAAGFSWVQCDQHRCRLLNTASSFSKGRSALVYVWGRPMEQPADTPGLSNCLPELPRPGEITRWRSLNRQKKPLDISCFFIHMRLNRSETWELEGDMSKKWKTKRLNGRPGTWWARYIYRRSRSWTQDALELPNTLGAEGRQ